MNLSSVNGISLGDGLINISPEEMNYINDVTIGEAVADKALIPGNELSITGLKSITLSEDFFSALVGVDNIIID